jgi:hypothetical protein
MLGLLLIIPIVGVLALSPMDTTSPHSASNIKRVALGVSVVNFIVSMVLWGEFDSSTSQYQFTQEFLPDQVTFCHLHIGIDGISLYFVLLTTFITPICILSNWDNIKHSLKYFLMSFLLLETLLIAVFVVLDILLFYIFFESVLIPLFLIVGIWGGSSTRVRAAYLLFLYTLFGSLFMLLAFLVIYYNVGSTDFNVVSLSEINTDSQRLLWLNTKYFSNIFFLANCGFLGVCPKKFFKNSLSKANAMGVQNFYYTTKSTTNGIDLVVFGTNMCSTVGYSRYNKKVQSMVVLTSYHYGVVVGVLLSDGWSSKQHKRGEARLSLKQSVKNRDYLFYTFFILSHYCYSYPHLAVTTLNNNNVHYSLFFYTRSLTCFTQLHNYFYSTSKKRVPLDIYNMLTIQGLAH